MFAKVLFVGALAALATAQSAVLSFTNVPTPVTVGQQVALTFATNDTASPVTILLRKGLATDLKTVATLTTDATNGQYIWTPAGSLVNGNDYALQITQGSQLNYFGPFSIQGSTASGHESSSSSAPSSYTSSSVAAPGYLTSSGSLTLTATASANGTASITMTATVPYATGNATVSRNATMISATLTRTASATGSGTASASAPASTGAASIVGGSALALVLGAVAAVVLG